MTILKGYTSSSGGQIHYAMKTGIGVPIVCFHQTASSGRSFYKLMEESCLKNPIYAFDTPGFGGSFNPDGMPSFEQYAEWILEAIKSIGIESFHSVGHHTGAGICVELAKNNPNMILSLIMIGPFPLTKEEREEFRPNFSTPIRPNIDGKYLIETWNYIQKLGANQNLNLHHEELIDHVRAYYSRYQTYSAVWDYDFTTPYININAPMLLMAAPDDVLYPYLQRAKELNSNTTCIEISGANFEPTVDSSNIANLIEQFITSNSF